MAEMTAFAVNEPFPIPGAIPQREGVVLELWEYNPVVIIQMPGLTREEKQGFKKGFKRYSYLDAYPVACWIFDFPKPFGLVDTSFNARLVNRAWVGNYIDTTEGVKNVLDFYLLDGDILKGIKRVGLEPDAVDLFHDTIRKQLAGDYEPHEYDSALAVLFGEPTEDLFKRGRVFKHGHR